MDAVSVRKPNQPPASPSICRSQSVTTSSNSVAAGEVRQSIAFTSRVAVRSSPSIPATDDEVAKYAKKDGWFQ